MESVENNTEDKQYNDLIHMTCIETVQKVEEEKGLELDRPYEEKSQIVFVYEVECFQMYFLFSLVFFHFSTQKIVLKN